MCVTLKAGKAIRACTCTSTGEDGTDLYPASSSQVIARPVKGSIKGASVLFLTGSMTGSCPQPEEDLETANKNFLSNCKESSFIVLEGVSDHGA